MAKSRSGEMVVYLFFEAGADHNLYKIDLPPMDILENSKSSSSPPMIINPLLELSDTEYPLTMSCARLGSKLYIFGGLNFQPPSPPPQGKNMDEYTIELINHVFPPSLHILDTTSSTMSPGPEMASGKSKPIVFVSKGMIYVLSAGRNFSTLLSWYSYELKTPDMSNTGDLMNPIKLFERYDPVEDKWHVLDDSPLQSMSSLKGYLLLEEDDKVVISSWENGNPILLVYDLDEEIWLSSSSLIPSLQDTQMLYSAINGPCLYMGGFCYGVGSDGLSLPIKSGPFHWNKESTNPCMSCVGSHDDFLLAPDQMSGICNLQHLGGGYFIFVSASPCWIEKKYIIMINIFKELLPTAGGSTQVDTASSTSFNAKIVFSQNYVCNMDMDILLRLSCVLVQSQVPTTLQSEDSVIDNEDDKDEDDVEEINLADKQKKDQQQLEVERFMLLASIRFPDRETLLSSIRNLSATLGYITVIKKSKGDQYVRIGCDRGGEYRNDKLRVKSRATTVKRTTGTRLINCPFEICGKRRATGKWEIGLKIISHNHPPSKDLSGHPSHRSFSKEEFFRIQEMTISGLEDATAQGDDVDETGVEPEDIGVGDDSSRGVKTKGCEIPQSC